VALGTPLDRWVDVYVPSARLSMGGEAFFEADSGDLQIGNGSYGPSTWVVRARARGIRLLGDNLHRIDPPPEDVATSRLLPRSYETDSAVKIVRFEMSLNCPVTSILTPIPGRWYFRTYWEPNTDMKDSELEKLFTTCAAQLVLSS
jgi:hypothetical protein